jgi:hypothetical protein
MKRLFRALRLAARDPRIPRPVRAVAAFGIAPIPGPVDEIVLLLVAPVLLFYRRELSDAWRRAGEDRDSG